MAHVREQIRLAAAAALMGLDTSGDRVFPDGEHPRTPGAMPGLSAALGKERNIGGTLKATTKEVEILIDAFAEGPVWEPAHNAMLAEIEAALYGTEDEDGRFFGGVATNLVYKGATVSRETGGAVEHGVLHITWTAEYQTEDGNAETAK